MQGAAVGPQDKPPPFEKFDMDTIWKFPLEMTDTQEVSMPMFATILAAGTQDNRLWLWARVESSAPREWRTFWVCGTGNPLPEDGVLKHIDSVLMPPFVWHVFEEV